MTKYEKYKKKDSEPIKPSIFWIEGLLEVFKVSFPHNRNDPREIGYKVGRQIIGLYIIEMLLKYALDNAGIKHGKHHNLHHLFICLSNDCRKAVEQKYKEILNSRLKETWDVAHSVDSI